MTRLFRRLSLRKQRAPLPTASTNPASSCPDLHDPCARTSAQCERAPLPDALLFKCLDYIDNPFELAHLRRVNRAVRDYVNQRFANVVEMDVRRVSFDKLATENSENSSQSSICSSTTSSASELSVMFERQMWYLHPHKYKILMRLEANRVEILVDEHWTSKEVVTFLLIQFIAFQVIILCGAMNVFRFNLTRISMDAPIIELVSILRSCAIWMFA
jgi:hypothetical protein